MIRLVPAHPDALPFPAFAVHAATEIREINHDQLSVELVEPDSMPAVVRIVWPPQPTARLLPIKTIARKKRWCVFGSIRRFMRPLESPRARAQVK